MSSTLSNSNVQDTTEQSIGHDFASSIRVSDLAIRSTAFTMSSTTMESAASTTKEKVNVPYTTVKPKRRVTFNLDNIQIKTISSYESSLSSGSDTSSLQEDSISTLCTKIQEPIIHEQPTSAERISKKESYDALQERKKFRRDHHQQPATKPGYWYPLASPRTPGSTRLTPTVRSLELTEKLIDETIQREMLLNPNIQQYTPPSPSPSPRSDMNDSTPLPCLDLDDEQVTPSTIRHNSVLVSDTEDEEDEEYGDEPTTTILSDETTTVISSNELNDTISSDEEDEPTTVLSSDEETNDFDSSVYHQVLPISNYEPPNLTFPFEQNLVPIITNKDVLIISPPPSPQLQQEDSDDNDNPVWIDHTSLLINKNSFQAQERRGIFFVKVLKAESLDFPIENDSTKTFCTINYKGKVVRSNHQIMSHTIDIENEMRIDDVDAEEQITITIHVEKKETNWYNRIRSSSADLERYIHDTDGSICQTSFSPNLFAIDGSSDQKATLMLVNNWYHETTPTTTSSLLKRSSFKKKKPRHTAKAVGKIYIQCLYITVANSCQYIPNNMNEALEALNTKRFHQTSWKSGYLFQRTEKSKEREPLYKIPLASVTKLTWDHSSVDDGFQLVFENQKCVYFSCQSLNELRKWIAVLEVMIYKLPELPEWVTS
ncbi:hypothetical protein INT48_003754 [Thamnidium elegans]|uniref:PH domain-containing protein n=1 Tax=Thamnidium elegans TaxID=101142 RepID=A0A8H7VWT3_9FUNG|nr:hypothetical protein INT48_003754 [Thamnidium elegans]